MNNFPAMTEAQVMWMIAHCARVMSESSPGDFEYLTAQIALAALTAKPDHYKIDVYKGDRLIASCHPSEREGSPAEDPYRFVETAYYTAPPAPVLTAELFAYSYLYAAYETCDGFTGWSHKFSLEHPPEWMLETGKVKNLRKLYTAPPAPVLRVPDGWIKCSERYPEVGQEVLIRIPVCEKFNIESGKYEGDGRFLGAWFDTRGKGRPYKVTHWMPLPPPPEDQG